MPVRLSKALLDAVFGHLEDCAAKGRRCPVKGDIVPAARGTTTRLAAHHVSALAYEGRIRVEVMGHNWRVVTILKGPHAGKSTAPCPQGWRPYIVLDAGGLRRLTVASVGQ